uniref:Repulsive guidance molecule N-terminal domain-containing protein n=1 Tax=Panagrellus redivivus TaxID=6233 RepID=A0A7E5A0H2_PANRE
MALALWIYFAEARSYYGRGTTKAPHCPIDYCSREYTKAMKNGLIPGDSYAYCQLVVEMLECVKRLVRHCPTNINVKSQLTGFSRENETNNCAKYKISPYHRRSTCPSWPDHRAGHQIRVCSFFGFEHLRTFGGQFETCTKIGANTLVENPFFIIQVTTAMVTIEKGLQMPAVTKIVLLVKNLDGCIDGQRYYEITREAISLPISFTDGTDNDTKVGITVHSENHVDIHLHYLNSTVYFRKAGKFIGVTVKMPLQLHRLSSENPHLCQNGCPTNSSLPLPQILADPSNYVDQCTALDYPLASIDQATDQCKKIGTVGDFKAFCLFDHILGDPCVAHMAYKTQLDVAHSAHVSTTSAILRKSRLEPPSITFDCVKPSSITRIVPSWRLIGILIAMYLFS